MHLAFYGDDFTGSTDALEQLTQAGLRTRLFIEPPTTEILASCGPLDAVGVAGMSRSMSPDEMQQHLPAIFTAFCALKPRHIHYKVCSTFDSSPTIGSIGKAIEIGMKATGSPWVPILVGAPGLGRYCLFGNLFARMGIGSSGAIHRLDRHPSMSRHPTTPAKESDLRIHLSAQTEKKTGLVDIVDISADDDQAANKLQSLLNTGCEIVFFDVLYSEQLDKIGKLLDASAETYQPLFSVGSSSIEAALSKAIDRRNMDLSEKHSCPNGVDAACAGMESGNDLSSNLPTLVISGSCSPVTIAQIEYATSHGFTAFHLNAGQPAALIAQAIKLLSANNNVIIHSNPAARKTTDAPVSASIIGTALGQIAAQILDEVSLQRLVIAGGDTSGYAARALGIKSIEMISRYHPGAPLCRAQSTLQTVDNIQIIFKGGQVGKPNFFIQ